MNSEPHECARYAVEGVLPGFATDAAVSALPDPNIIMFSERNSEALDSSDNGAYGNVGQDDYGGIGAARVIVGDEDPFHHSFRKTGNRTVTMVPLPIWL